MSESRTECPICHRAPGSTHVDFCPRSRVRVTAHRGPSGGRVSYMAKGTDISERDGEQVVVRNPGFPYVDCKPTRPHGLRRTERREVKRQRRRGMVLQGIPKDWTAGGLPLGFDRESALEFMREQAVRPVSAFMPPPAPAVVTIAPPQLNTEETPS